MAISTECAGCGKQYRVDDRAAGRKLRCKNCGHTFTVVAPPPPAVAREQDPFEALVAMEQSATPLPADQVVSPPLPPPRSSPPRVASMPPVYAPPARPSERAKRPASRYGRHSTGGIGADNVTPWLVIGYIVAEVLMALVASFQPSHAGAAGRAFTTGAIWTIAILDVIFLFLVLGPAVYLGVFLTSRIFRFEMVDLPYFRGCGVAALPGVVLVLAVLLPRNFVLVLVMLLAIVPLAFFVLKTAFDLDWAGGAVGFIFSGALYTGAQLFAKLVLIAAVVAQFPGGGSSPTLVDATGDSGVSDPGSPAPPAHFSPPSNASTALDTESMRSKTEENLRQIGQAAQRFCQAAPGTPLPAALSTLVTESDLPAHCLNSPFKRPAQGGYFYWPGRSSGMPANVALAYDSSELPKLQGTHVLFADGSVQWKTSEELASTISLSNQSVLDWQEDQKALEKKRLASMSQAAPPADASPSAPPTLPPAPEPPAPKQDAFLEQFKLQKTPFVAQISSLTVEGDIAGIVQPPSASPWVVLVHAPSDARDVVELWDLAAGAKKADASFTHEAGQPGSYILNPAGTLLARIVQFPKMSVRVWSFKEGRELRTIVLNEKFGTPALAGFLNADKFAVRWTRDAQEGLEVWDATNGQHGKQIPLESYARTLNNGVSTPDGRYLGLTTAKARNGKPQVEFYDLLGSAGGYRWQAITDVDGAIVDAPTGMAFSPDGKKLAALFARGGAAFLVCWRASDGKMLGEYDIPVPTGPQSPDAGRGLDWVHNGSAWLIMGNTLIDSATGRFIGQLNAPANTGQWLIGPDAFAFTYDSEGKTHIATVKLDGSKFPGPTTAP